MQESEITSQETIDRLNKLSKVIRYVGLNLTPQVLSLILNNNIVSMVNRINDAIETSNGDINFATIDDIVAEIDSQPEVKS